MNPNPQILQSTGGFNVENDPSFEIAHHLRDVAELAVGAANVLDLSQGEPGYGDTPCARSRDFHGGLVLMDSVLNDRVRGVRVVDIPHGQLLKYIRAETRSRYVPKEAAWRLSELELFVERGRRALAAQGLPADDDAVLRELLEYSNLSGGRYPRPHGANLFRALMAQEHSKMLGVRVRADELIPVQGASHGVATIFAALGVEGIGHIGPGDVVLTTSPIYAPFMAMFEERGVQLLSLPLDPRTGECPQADVEATLGRASGPVKAVFLVQPNNPTGFPLPITLLRQLAQLAVKEQALLITDEVYSGFFSQVPSFAEIPSARRHWLRCYSLSKIERSAGLRVGDIYLSDNANVYLSKLLGARLKGRFKDLRELLTLARSPGGTNIGLFRHINGLAGPSFSQAVAHLTLGGEDRARFVGEVHRKAKAFYHALGVEHYGNHYFGLLDLRALAAPSQRKVPLEEMLLRLARRGLVLMPACRFFAASDRTRIDRRHWVRVSLPNLEIEDLRRAAEIMRDELGMGAG